MIDELLALINSNMQKTLDKQIEEMKEYLSSYTITASDDVYLGNTYDYEWKEATTGNVDIDVLKLKMKVTGTVKFTWDYLVSITASAETNKSNNYFTVYKNGVKIAESSGSSSYGSRLNNITADVAKGDILTFHVKTNFTSGLSRATLTYINACGTLQSTLDQNLIELISN